VFYFLVASGDTMNIKIGFLIYVIAGLTDWYDGWYARKYKSITKLGIFLDPLADKVLISFAFLLFFKLNIIPLWMVLIIIIRDVVVTSLRSYEEFKGRTLVTSYIAKIKTFIQMVYVYFIIFLLFVKTFDISPEVRISIDNFIYNSIVNLIIIWIITLITIFTGISYFYEVRTEEVK
jgi:CDP-diacylglycerol--glycerol-3-phosphate 3-phosphatidyltransferase